ncbi:hypothetical protein EJ110_NYTH53862 [Nymphaea thermarum]|nr:hypothetical protein EJ110_NYTH53862 [Nymphaea thermarum]
MGKEKRGAKMIVSILIATLTYQASLNPPGGFWQDDKFESVGNNTAASPVEQSANVFGPTGTAINRNINGFQLFLIANTVALFASLVIILILTSAKTVRRRRMMWLLMALMWISCLLRSVEFLQWSDHHPKRSIIPSG